MFQDQAVERPTPIFIGASPNISRAKAIVRFSRYRAAYEAAREQDWT